MRSVSPALLRCTILSLQKSISHEYVSAHTWTSSGVGPIRHCPRVTVAMPAVRKGTFGIIIARRRFK
jgi:hypothetical protein